MSLSKQIAAFPFMSGCSEALTESFIELASPCSLKTGDVLAEQFQIGHHLYFLMSGEISISLPLREASQSYNVGTINTPLAPIGWSAFRHPSRYATTFIATKTSKLLAFPILKLQKLLNENLDFANQFLQFVYQESLPVLTNIQNQTRPFFSNETMSFEETRPLQSPTLYDLSIKEASSLLTYAPFCESFTQTGNTQFC